MKFCYIKMRLGSRKQVAEEIVSEFERTIESETAWVGKTEWPLLFTRAIKGFSRYFPGMFNLSVRLTSRVRDERGYFAVLMGIGNIYRTIPWFLYSSQRRAVYLFDAWEPQFDSIAEVIRQYRMEIIFFSARQAALHFKSRMPELKCYWVPEGIAPEPYRAAAYQAKDTDVLQLGRKYDRYHEAIVGFCEQQGISYLYERVKGEIIFPTHAALTDGLARTKISICFPSSLTHPQRSGCVSTMTQRYLQSMLARCLIVGTMPEEMKELFDYCPIIEADLNRPAEQLQELLVNFSDYIPLIEKNHQTVMENHLWKHRIARIARLCAGD